MHTLGCKIVFSLPLLIYVWRKELVFPQLKETLEKWEKLCRKLYSKHRFYFCIPSVEVGQREAKNINPVQSKNL